MTCRDPLNEGHALQQVRRCGKEKPVSGCALNGKVVIDGHAIPALAQKLPQGRKRQVSHP